MFGSVTFAELDFASVPFTETTSSSTNASIANDPAALASAARCLSCLDGDTMDAIISQLMCNWATNGNAGGNFRITQAGEIRITEAGEPRIVQ